MYYLVYSIFKLLSLIPFRLLYVLSDILYYPFYYVIRYRRKIVRKNLTESFPEKGLDEILSIEKKFYRFFIDMMLESVKFISMTPEETRKRMKFGNISIVNEKLREGKTVSAFLGHYANWEWMASIALWLCEEAVCAQIYHRLRNQVLDKLMKYLRERMGSICIDMYKTARFVANTATDDKSYMIGFLADQSPKFREVRYFTHFLNHEVPILVGTEKITKHYGFEAVFAGMKRVKRGYYECTFTFLHDNPSSLPDYELSELYYQKLEEEIRQQPECYLWTHNRFKHAKKN